MTDIKDLLRQARWLSQQVELVNYSTPDAQNQVRSAMSRVVTNLERVEADQEVTDSLVNYR